MSYRIGDAVFNYTGKPGLLVAKDPINGNLQVADDQIELKEKHRHGYINGLEVNEREEFNKFLDQVKEKEDPYEKLKLFQDKIEDLSKDPRNRIMTRYIMAEMSHFMQSNGIQPRIYNISPDRIPK